MGMTLRFEIDTRSLPKPQGEELARMVETCRFFELTPKLHANTGGADRFEYEITVDDTQRNNTVIVNDGGIPPSLQPLLDALVRIARSNRLSK